MLGCLFIWKHRCKLDQVILVCKGMILYATIHLMVL
jgi:hypothetical protein